MQIGELQAAIKSRDFDPRMAHGYFLKLIEEVGELSEAVRKGARRQSGSMEIKGTIDEELFDVLYYVLALANIYGIDMEEAAILKEQVNASRAEFRDWSK